MADSYVNTRETLGDQGTLDALVSGSLEHLVEDGVKSLTNQYAIYYNTGIKSVKFPNLERISVSDVITRNSQLILIDIGKKCTFGAASIRNNAALASLILRGDTMSTHANSMLSGSLLARGYGGVYVPADLVATYKANSSWSQYNIYSIDDYPVTDFSTISDSWSDILANETNGTYSTKYSVGDTKLITIDNSDYYAQIVAFDADELSDESGNAKITWILKELYGTHNMNPAPNTNANGWPESAMRSHLSTDILPLIPEPIKSAIKEVKKTSYDKTTSADVTSNDKLWIPSAREVFTSSGYGYEASGPSYTSVFSSNANRSKYKYNGASYLDWWLRSAGNYNTATFQSVNTGGSLSIISAINAYGVCLGFCT